MITRPLLAGKIDDLSKIVYPVLATPKLDGIRCLKIDGQVVSRKFKPIPNTYIREQLEKVLPDGVDGEIMLAPGEDFNKVQSAVMSFEGEPNYTYHMFDYVRDQLEEPYEDRMKNMYSWYVDSVNEGLLPQLKIFLVMPVVINNEEDLLTYETSCLAEGYEGVMIRVPSGKYKCGRSTVKEGILLKIKRFHDAEATVIGFKERQHNTNEKEKDEFGLSKRSSKKDGMVGSDTLGALLVRMPNGVEFDIGTGFDDALRAEIWNNQDKYINTLVKYKYQEIGKEKPRFPVYLGFRHTDDT